LPDPGALLLGSRKDRAIAVFKVSSSIYIHIQQGWKQAFETALLETVPVSMRRMSKYRFSGILKK
jgi:hypothetical protein